MSLVDFIYKVIRQQTNLIGQPVTNLYGAVPGQSPAILNQQDSSWVVVTVGGISGLPSLDQFYSMYATATTKKYQTLKAVDGVVGIMGNISTGGAPTVSLFRGVVELPGATVVPLGVVTNGPNNPFAVYVDGILQRQGSGTLNLALSLAAGRHILEVVAMASDVYVGVPASMRVFYDLDVLEAPVWESVSTDYLDAAAGIPGITLSWYNDNRVGGWIVYRRVLTYLGLISTLGTPDNYGGYSLEIDGDYSDVIRVGDELVSGNETIGNVLASSYDEDTLLTIVTLQLPTGVYSTSPFWAGRTAAVGRFAEQTRLSRNSSVGTVQWIDTNIIVGVAYEYQLCAYGLFDPAQLSAPSLLTEIVAGDVTPPDSITFDAGYPQVYDDQVTVAFTTPIDADYDGVQVQYYENPVSGTSSGSNTATTLNDTTKSLVVDAFAGYYLFITTGTGAGQSVLIDSNTATQFVLNSGTPWNTSYVPDATSTYDVYKLVPIITDYGVGNAPDQLTFKALGEGVYCFRTFDRGRNMQSHLSCTTWEYSRANQLAIPLTSATVSNISQTGQVNANLLGITLYSIPQQPDLFLDTFTGPQGFKLTGTLLTSGTSDSSGSTVTTLKDTGAGWSVNAYAGKKVRISTTTGILAGRVVGILSNTSDTLTLDSALPIAPDSINFQVLDMFPGTIDVSVLGTSRDRWTPSSTSGVIDKDALWFAGSLNSLYTTYIDSAYTGKNTPFRLEAVITRGNTHPSGSNLTYRGTTTNGNRWEYGIVHSSDNVVIPRYRYDSGGAGAWTNLGGVSWNRYTSGKLIVELDNDTHTFKFADAYGHNEVVLGRITGTAGPLDSCIGWSVHGESGGDAFDTVRMLDFSKLVRIKYRVLPEDTGALNVQYLGTANSGSTTSLNDTSKLWYTDELKGLRVLITGGAGAGSDRLILSNTATQLVPTTAFSAAINYTSTYKVYDPNFTGTERLQFWRNRDPNNVQTLEFHGERSGTPNENIKRVLIDANQVPEIVMSVIKTATVGSNSEVTISITPDDDVKAWSLYAKKGAWPTLDNTPSGPLDYQYIRWQKIPASFATKTLQVADGTWYFIGVPYDSNDSEGIYATTSLSVSSGGAVATSLTNVVASRVGTSNNIKVSWSHSSDIESPATTHSLNIYATNTSSGVSYTLIEALRPWSENGGANSVSGSGYYLDDKHIFGMKNIDPYVSLRYDIELIEDATGLVLRTYTASFSFYGNFLQ